MITATNEAVNRLTGDKKMLACEYRQRLGDSDPEKLLGSQVGNPVERERDSGLKPTVIPS